MLQRAASNAYSWWWASHIRTRQSKWLDTNLQDMDERIKRILFLLGEEADTFAKRAEMYYKRRPEVIGSVEEAYRAYRALAERYDHMSGELHKANHTVAAAFPDQVQYAMLDDQQENDNVDSLPKAFTTVDPRRVRKATVDELMKKKKKEKTKKKKSGRRINNGRNVQAEIGRLQKEILVLQTEKEFIKSCYESGIAKFWDLEKRINDMQEEVCCFHEEEFGEEDAAAAAVTVVIEDDEARALMTASALKSCEDAIAKVQREQMSCFKQAIGELERANASKQKLKNIMEDHGKLLPDSGDPTHENAPRKDVSVKIDDVYSVEWEEKKMIEIEAMVDKIKGYFQRDDGISVADIAEKIDELVDKVADLELMASSQTAKVERMCLENTELEKTLKELEEEENTVVVSCRSGELDEKLDKAKDELIRVQCLESSFHAEESVVCSNFTETVTSFYDILDMLQLQSSPMIVHRADSAADTLADEAAAALSADTEPSGGCEGTEPEDGPQMDEANKVAQTDGDCLSKLEIAVTSDNNSQSSSGYPHPDQTQPEKHHNVDDDDDSENLLHFGIEETSTSADASVDDDSENLLHFGIEETSTSADASVDDETRENEDDNNNTFGEHDQNSEGEQHGGETVGDSNIVHSDERDSSVTDHSISEGHSAQETTNKAEEDCENSAPGNGNGEVVGVGVGDHQEEDMANLQQLLMSGLQDKEKVLLTEYTSILRNYKNTKRTLVEVETKNQEYLSGMAAMVSELRHANAMKDEEIRSLHELLNYSSNHKNASQNGNHGAVNPETSSSFKSGNFRRGHRRSGGASFSRRRSVSSISRIILMNSSSNLESANEEGDASLLHDVVMDPESIFNLDELKSITSIAETSANLSPVESKFRRDIDGLLEENLEFWLKLSASFQKIQEFQTRHEQLQTGISNLKNKDGIIKRNSTSSGGGGADDRGKKSEPDQAAAATTEKQVRELKIEVQVWLEQTAMLRRELQCRFASLCAIHDEIQEATTTETTTDEGDRLAAYQAARFTGEIMNMKQENSKLADELQAGADHVTEMVEKLMPKMVDGGGGGAAASRRDGGYSRARVPLRSFLFPAKRKKKMKTPALFRCVNPALQKQHSDMAFFSDKME